VGARAPGESDRVQSRGANKWLWAKKLYETFMFVSRIRARMEGGYTREFLGHRDAHKAFMVAKLPTRHGESLYINSREDLGESKHTLLWSLIFSSTPRPIGYRD